MKIDQLASVAHNVADSLASGWSNVFNLWDFDVYEDAERSPNGVLEIDLLNGTIASGSSSPAVVRALECSPQILARLVSPHGDDAAPPKTAKLKFFIKRSHLGTLRCFSVYVEDADGKRREHEFYGSPGRKVPPDGKVPATAWI